ncbi:hypothetical protein KFE25_009069 [Diacronema lutheri]|uniref:Uncharacterized protein n=1 Tax=Diacronema lutheri TaxID=2081491 RepID=A0A8J6CK38_DIALT|nr:hypothetical protein KFE25_009069 [Diacronema lutheri]
MADERAARLDAERRIDAANHRAAQSQVRAADLEEELAMLQAEQAELSGRQALLEAEVVQLAAMADASALIGRRAPFAVQATPVGAAGALGQQSGSRAEDRALPLSRSSSGYGFRAPSRPITPRGALHDTHKPSALPTPRATAQPSSVPPSLRSSLRESSVRDAPAPGERSAQLRVPARDAALRSVSPRRELALRMHNIANDLAHEIESQDRLEARIASIRR